MAPMIEVSSETFALLSARATPLVDNADDVIRRLLAAAGPDVSGDRPLAAGGPHGVIAVDPMGPLANLRHAIVTAASIDGEEIADPTWNRLMDHAIAAIMRHDGPISPSEGLYQTLFGPISPSDGLYQALFDGGREFGGGRDSLNSPAAFVRWAKTTKVGLNVRLLSPHMPSGRGWRDLPDLGIAVQGVSSGQAWRITRQLAAETGVMRLRVAFTWKDVEGAAHPGRNGEMCFDGHASAVDAGGGLWALQV